MLRRGWPKPYVTLLILDFHRPSNCHRVVTETPAMKTNSVLCLLKLNLKPLNTTVDAYLALTF